MSVLTPPGTLFGTPVTLFRAKGFTRVLKVEDNGWMTVRLRWLWGWVCMGKRRREGRPMAVAFPLSMIRGGWFRAARWYRMGVLVLDVPGANDPWQRRTDRQRRKGTFPKPRPHKIFFNTKQSPAFELCAREIGIAQEG